MGKFKHWAPLTLEGLCGHPCNDGKLCNSNAGKCSKHRQRELFLMAREDERAVIMERGVCGVPEAGGGPCQQPWGQCSIHMASWHQKRELRAMRAEDDASCIADRGRCGVVPRGGGDACGRPRTRCPHHAAEHERCHSMVDDDPSERCRSRRAEGSNYCAKHADYPNYSMTVQRWVVDRRQHGFAFDEEDFMAHIRAKYPGASFQQPRCHDFQKYVGHFANLGAAAERCRSRSPKHT